MYTQLKTSGNGAASKSGWPMKQLRSRYLFSALVVLFMLWLLFKLYEPFALQRLNDASRHSDEQQPLYQNNQELPTRPFDKRTQINLNELFELGACLTKEAGKRIVEIRKAKKNEDFSDKKEDKSPVTEADLMSHNIIVHAIEAKFGESALRVISEEKPTQKDMREKDMIHKCDWHKYSKNDVYVSAEDVTVWVDPLDATQEFSENLVEYVTVMLCIAVKGVPKAGIIHNPFTNQTVESFLETKTSFTMPTAVANNKTDNVRVIISRSHAGNVAAFIKERLINKAEVISAGGSGYKTLSLIQRKADLYLHTTSIKKWDLCAPNAIMNNMGGKMTQKNGDAIDFTSDKKSIVVDGLVASFENHAEYVRIFQN